MTLPRFLYCLEFIGAPIAKIGTTSNPMHRLSRLSQTAPFEMRFRRVFRFMDDDTASVHERRIIAKANSYRDRGEWVSCDPHLDSLLDACPGQDVTADFALEMNNGRRRRVGRKALALDLEAQVGPRAAKRASYSGGAKTYDAAVVRARLADGYGAQDILVMDGIPEDFTWGVVRDLEAKGRLRALLRPARLAAE